MTAAFDAYVAPARRRPALWRLGLGTTLVAAFWLAAVLVAFVPVVALRGPEVGARWLDRVGHGSDPVGALILLSTFAGPLAGALLASRPAARTRPAGASRPPATRRARLRPHRVDRGRGLRALPRRLVARLRLGSRAAAGRLDRDPAARAGAARRADRRGGGRVPRLSPGTARRALPAPPRSGSCCRACCSARSTGTPKPAPATRWPWWGSRRCSGSWPRI